MRTAKCKSCGWRGTERDLMKESVHGAMLILICPECSSLELILEPANLFKMGKPEFLKSVLGKEAAACQNVKPSPRFADDQEAALLDHSDVAICGAGYCDCWLDRVIDLLHVEDKIDDEDADGLHWGQDQDREGEI